MDSSSNELYDPDHCKCCDVVSMCGQNLKKGVTIVCIVTIVSAITTFSVSLTNISTSDYYNEPFRNHSVAGVRFLFGLYSCGIALYQILISGLLLWTTVKRNGSIYACSLWYISHVSIIFGYCVLFLAWAVACFVAKFYIHGVLILLFGIFYTGTFVYFGAVVNSYSYVIVDPVYN